jgi:signal transduction histidine kinase
VWRRITSTVRNKLLFVVLATTFTALLVAGGAMMLYDMRTYEQGFVNDMTTQADIIGRASAAALVFDDPRVALENLALLKARPRIAAAAIYKAKGGIFATYSADDLENVVRPQLPEADGFRIEGSTLHIFKRVIDNNEILGTVYLRANYDLNDRLKRYLGILAAVMALSLLVAAAVSVWLQATITRPILSMRDVARRVMEERDFSLRAARTSDDEIGYLVDSFNDMLAEVGRRAESLEKSIADQHRAEGEILKLNAELERRVSERTSQLEEANKELEGFSYSVSHDLRAPLRAVAGFTKLLGEDHKDQLDAEAHRKLSIIQGEADRMGVLIDDLLAFSRLGRKAIQKVPLDMRTMAGSTYERLLAQHQGPKPEWHLGALPAGMGDRTLLEQVWANFLSNALKFSAKREQPTIEVGGISDEKEHVYFVRDNGAGFDPRYQAKLFGVFQRLHHASEFAGTGVGLALVHRIVTRHGGRVWAESKPGEGATFYFSLPKEQSNG